ncbi:MAG TPA: phosphodiester glycosidase family protein [Candidatus Kapabacteria bacterium]|jgi:hypothetical protein|nr:phosphodiester glycosidase family protein [Ignavibacteria bacterium]HRE56826.1 phosphodiester glycosidase family protein [Candidatus Kapabacteria bacterium]
MFFLLRHSILTICIILIGMVCCTYTSEAKSKPKPKKSVARTAKKTKKVAKTSTKRSKKKRKSAPVREEVFPQLTVVWDTVFSPGMRTKIYSYGRSNVLAHVVEVNNNDPTLRLGIIKGQSYISGLERLGDMMFRMDSTQSDSVLCAVNANFWSAYRNVPIGPLVIDGEVAQMTHHKKWSSAFFDERNRMIIDTFRLTGTITLPRKKKYMLSDVNIRRDTTGIVLYNTYAGKTVPYVHETSIEKAVQEFVENHKYAAEDSTESELDINELREAQAEARRARDKEFPMWKVKVRHLRLPRINLPTPCLVLGVHDSGTVSMPLRGSVISFDKSFSLDDLPKVGDTVYYQFTTTPFPTRRFANAVSGTPRLVRNGIAKHEAMEEGARAVRFRNHGLARTAIGQSRDGKTTYIVMVEPPTKGKNNNGATLQTLANLMRDIGAWNAMNLDGGGSSMMTICNTNVCTNTTIPSGRRISAALALFRRSKLFKPHLIKHREQEE